MRVEPAEREFRAASSHRQIQREREGSRREGRRSSTDGGGGQTIRRRALPLRTEPAEPPQRSSSAKRIWRWARSLPRSYFSFDKRAGEQQWRPSFSGQRKWDAKRRGASGGGGDGGGGGVRPIILYYCRTHYCSRLCLQHHACMFQKGPKKHLLINVDHKATHLF